MNAKILYIASITQIVLCSFALGEESSSLSSQNNEDSTTTDTNISAPPHNDLKDIQKVQLGKSTAIAEREFESYQSGAQVGRDLLDSNPSGNGDIGSILRILPNVQYDIAQQRSTTPGEIDPAKISISGGLHYQNNFQLDGMNINNDLNPMGTAGFYGGAKGHTQGLNIDTSLLESITVQDSNISASYGGFTGGVVEANTRRPTKKYGANISYQFTQGNANPKAFSLTNYHINATTDAQLSNFINSSSESNQPIFTKHLIRASTESKVNERFGMLANFSSTLSFIPLFAASQSSPSYSNPTYDSPINTTDDATAKHNTNRASYNVFFKTYYDFSPNVRTEFTYSYAPQRNTYSVAGAKNQFYTSILGGHQAGLKTTWDNALGTLTNTLSYSYMENSTQAIGYTHHKFWIMSESKNWTNWHGDIRDGAYAPYDSTQHTLSNKIVQDFREFEVLKTTHRFLLGVEIAYQYVQNSNPRLYFASSHKPRPMTKAQQALCLQTNLEWCDPSKVYPTLSNELIKDQDKAQYGDAIQEVQWNGKTLQVWQYGQFIGGSRSFLKGKADLDNALGAVFAEDDIAIPFWRLGEINARVGMRVDADSYMKKATFAPRFSLNYITPAISEFKTQITAGANRYYGRNIFAYALADIMSNLRRDVTRSNPNISFESILDSGNICPPNPDTTMDCIYTVGRSTTKFNELKVPYVDELMAGIAQQIQHFTLGIKYIYRLGRDEVRRSTRNISGLPADSNYQSNYYVWTNEGKSTTNVLTISFQNDKPIDLFGIKHFMLFAFDWTNVKRNYTDYTDTLSNAELANQWISWNGQMIRYADKPAENFVRPYTIRLNTTHNFNIGRFKWLWNNFFRYRSSYNAMASTPASYGGVNNRPQPDSFNGIYVDTFRPLNIKGAFTWDIRLGFEVSAWRGKSTDHTLYMNVDIYNVLNSKNLAIASASYSATAGTTATPVYEVGRQFWLQVGYKF